MLVQQFQAAVAVVRDSSIIVATVELVAKVFEAVMDAIPMIRGSGYLFYGGLNLHDGLTSRWDFSELNKNGRLTRKVCGFLQGVALLGAGICGIWAEVDTLAHQVFSNWDYKLFLTGNSLFFAASVLGLYNNSFDYLNAETENEQINALIGIAAQIVLVAAACFILTGFNATLIVTMCSIGTTLSLFQLLHSFHHSEYGKSFYNGIQSRFSSIPLPF